MVGGEHSSPTFFMRESCKMLQRLDVMGGAPPPSFAAFSAEASAPPAQADLSLRLVAAGLVHETTSCHARVFDGC